LDLVSERFHPGGAIDARAARRALGQPDLGFWELFLREALQNSWDARMSDADPVRFSVDAWSATRRQRQALRQVVFANIVGLPQLQATLAGGSLDLLVVSDSGTRGLGGPTRADETWRGDRNDFADFVRNIGRDERKGYGSGTYGFGKGVFYDASLCGTVVVYSRTVVRGHQTSRLIAIALGEQFDHRGVRYTGRHWWGRRDRAIAEPLTGKNADELAASLGFDRLLAAPTGTAVMVLAPQLEPAGSRQDVIRTIAQAAAWHAWPHMIPRDGRGASVLFDLTFDGSSVAVPSPGGTPELRHFAAAYRRCEDLLAGTIPPGEDWPWTLCELWGERPRQRLGVLAYLAHRPLSRASAEGGESDDIRGEVALMRSPRFVVKYLTVTPHVPGKSTAGVFVADPDLDEQFARSEPPAHDDWIPKRMGLERYTRNPVRQALDRLGREFRRARVGAMPSPEMSQHHPGAVEMASLLGDLMDGHSPGTDPRIPDLGDFPVPARGPRGRQGPRGGTDTPDQRSPTDRDPAWKEDGRDGTGTDRLRDGSDGWRQGRGPRATARLVTDTGPRLRTADGHLIVEFDVGIRFPQGARTVSVTAIPSVVVDGGRESDAPAGAENPTVIGWGDPASGAQTPGPTLRISAPGDTRWTVHVRQPADTAVTLEVRVEEEP
jgi:hypothetical protein